MTRIRCSIALLCALLAGLVLAEEVETEAPALSIVSSIGVDEDVKLFNDEPVLFSARLRGRENAPLLRGVTFLLYDEGGQPHRTEDVRAKSEDLKRWGVPPSTFEYPVVDRSLPVGRYRLRAIKSGWQFAEIKVVMAEFGYCGLSAEHERDFYRASFHLRLVDCAETRRNVPVTVRVEAANGGLLDSLDARVVRNTSRTWLWESPAPVRISSRAKSFDMKKEVAKRTGLLKLVPHCRVVLVLDGIRFAFPVPLPPEMKSGNVRSSGGFGGKGRGRSGR